MKKSIASNIINKLSRDIQYKYGIRVTTDDKTYASMAFTRVGVDGDLSISIGVNMQTQGHLWNKQVCDVDFLKCICSIYHEEEHIIQNAKKYYELCPTEDIIQMCLHQFAGGNNRKYYTGMERYCNDLSEIDAEAYGLLNTYQFLIDSFPNADANKMICDLVNHKIATSDYFISGHYDNIDDILDAFSNHYEQAKTAPVSYPVFAFYKNEDECIRFLQWCMKDNIENQPLIDKFNETANPHEKDLLIASITHHLHPEILYEKIYPCLKDIELAPEEVFGRSLPIPPEGMVENIDANKIRNRIEIANTIHNNVLSQKYNRQDYQNKTGDIALNESLLPNKENNDEYSL